MSENYLPVQTMIDEVNELLVPSYDPSPFVMEALTRPRHTNMRAFDAYMMQDGDAHRSVMGYARGFRDVVLPLQCTHLYYEPDGKGKCAKCKEYRKRYAIHKKIYAYESGKKTDKWELGKMLYDECERMDPPTDVGFVRRMIQAGAPVDNIYEFCGGKTALHWATIRGYVEVVKLLLEHHANPRHRDHHHNTVLHHAALSTKGRQLIPLFLERKINIHARDQDGDTALHLATIFGDFDCIRMLLMAGASYSIKNKEGCYPRQMEGAIGKTRLYLFHCEMKQTYVETFHVYGMLPVDLVRMLCRYLI